MINLNRILCPTDFSEFSARAFGHAVALAKWYEATIAALHVYAFVAPPPTKLPTIPTRPHLTPETREALLAGLREFAGPAREAGIPLETRVVEGDPVAVILGVARELRADLIVLGTHGRGGFERWVLGSVTEKILRKAACPVLTVPPLAAGLAPEDLPAFRHILCPVDFSEASLRALEYAFSLAKEADTRLSLMHSIESLPEEEPPESLRFDSRAYGDYLRRVAGDRLLGLVPEGARDWCRPEVVVATGKAYREILKAAGERGAGLIVMGVHGRSPIDLMLFGSTTAHVARQAACPVLTIRSA